MLVISKDSVSTFVEKEAGGKGHNLYLLSKAGFKVPKWYVLGASFYDAAINKDLESKIIDILENSDNKKTASGQITKLIMQVNYSDEMLAMLKEVYAQFNGEIIAVRSSALDEDSASHSFAGQLSSFLYIKSFENYLESIKMCWASGFSERSLVYREQNNLNSKKVKVSVVIQKMIDPEKSGVFFTSNPINQKFNEMIINAVYGVGEGLVSGALEADTVVYDKRKLELISESISEKEKRFIQDFENQGIKEELLPTELKTRAVLTKKELQELSAVGKSIENYYSYPQDIEWAIKDDEVYNLQSRPITTSVQTGGELYIWDNSNIVESYGGITKPLTFGFAKYVYHQVYVQFCEILMVPQKEIKNMNDFLQNMLGLFYGRVYYNLLNWYRLTNILPGYKYNRSFMETMMGTDEALADEVAQNCRPEAYQNTLGARIKKVITGFKFFYFHLNIQNIVDDFLKHFYEKYKTYKQKDYFKMSSDEIYNDYKKLEKDLLWKWHAPIINDFLCMIHYGIFKKLTEKWLNHLGENFHNDLLAGNGNLESAEPTKILIQMAGEASQHENLKKLLLETPNNKCLESLRQSPYEDFYKRALNYIDRFGFRCMSEMKLEQKDLVIDPSLLFVFLKNLINSGQTDLEVYEQREKAIKEKAEDLLKKNISGLKKIAYSWSLKHARKAVMNRENTRFCRTRVYGIVRKMFYGMGRDFVQRDILDHEDDIFYISLEELKGSFEGTNSIQNLRKVVEVRKSEYESYEDLEPNSRFMTRGPVYWMNQHFPPAEEPDLDIELKENELIGIGCCPGKIEGIAKVILSSDDDMVLNGEILVTYRTDPGWIPLYPSAKGLLVERGGLLSHSAIVAREMGLPTIVSIKGLTKRIKTGDRISFNGETGLIEILESV